MRFVRFFVCLAIALFVFYFMQFGLAAVPPIGKLLNPYTGFWQNAELRKPIFPDKLDIAGLKAPVSIVWDNRLVPHIFAQNDHDLYMAQGYVTAKMRLWQMEFQTHVAAGRASEIIGKRALQFDKHQRKKGMSVGAQKALNSFKNNPKTMQILNAYTKGINAYIATLSYRKLPLEYKLLDYYPEKWTNFKSALLLKYMSNMLTGYSTDIQLSNFLKNFGPKWLPVLYPDFPDTNLCPIVPKNISFNNYPKQKLKMPTIAYDTLSPSFFVNSKYKKNLGSNNWVVSGTKTVTGHSILCNDPHLKLNLPSLWFEIQLQAPGINVYGVSLPGAPSVIIGFNKNIAWGVTNASMDVKDWYTIKWKNADSKKFYWYDSTWHKTKIRIEKILTKEGEMFYDTVYTTIHGPVVKTNANGQSLSMCWTGLAPSNELLTFHYLNRADSYAEFLHAIQYFETPGQNFVFAGSRSNNIAIWQQGKFPLRWPGQGKLVLDGSNPLYQWQGFIPQAANPHLFNPERGFVYSANQHPTTPAYPYYYFGYYEYFRNRRIYNFLKNKDNITISDMMALQNDTKNLMAKMLLPTVIKILDTLDNLPGYKYLTYLKKWDYYNTMNSKAASVFDVFNSNLMSTIWDELNGAKYVEPNLFTTYRIIIKNNPMPFWDNAKTNEKDSRKDIVQIAWVKTVKELNNWRKNNKNESIAWFEVKNTTVKHLLQEIAPFNVSHIKIGGGANIVNATSSRYGPSWRMVVSMETPVRAFGIYPGGQSGNPGSYFYAHTIKKWAKGEYFQLNLMQNVKDADTSIMQTTLLLP